ncbi:protein AroM [Murinocardiopsis flavida]|uniref:Protein AroM n=1 Tax=Murinocardiopsis flavida TaxID=645275 RepID=A0A2P8DTQ3_9ACTN|nr:AroM family protein [Murinocardiopsis flavida]PSL00597.1 protein AroM [Murinocardiopsis flavida]
MTPRLGIVTIGQAPRTDIVPDLGSAFDGIEPVEHGALDGLDTAAIAALAPEQDEEVLVTRLRDGNPVRLAHHRIRPLVESAVARAEADEVAATLVVCTAPLGNLAHTRPVLAADSLLVHAVAGLAQGRTLGVVCPDPRQQEAALAKWWPHAGVPRTAAADPYGDEAPDAAADAVCRLADEGADLAVLDCMGYTEATRARASDVGSIPVLLARSVVAALAREMVR